MDFGRCADGNSHHAGTISNSQNAGRKHYTTITLQSAAVAQADPYGYTHIDGVDGTGTTHLAFGTGGIAAMGTVQSLYLLGGSDNDYRLGLLKVLCIAKQKLHTRFFE